ncbi:TPA: hypothetical protein JAN90_12040 [Legionella pneumophila]|uniref:hypothetical protein n=1 Tax=Legionella TaxID=445 RepID=UPI0010AA1E9D|nr:MULTISPECIES: hypothetical protein [Legionella]MBN9229554.1 hypothetical protein [Legionella sp.]HAT7073475.1 hypothetical protein [Legionella pneumophila]HAT9471196.1 hypothetical protein [Legionella pneumophila subsp. pneumophila]QLZ70892.1 hypothetical protein FOLKNPGA_03711 [Legionella sp. PC1000]TID49677.1 hypothetical protein DIZ64_09690 [Legionella taurinensis]
MSNKPTFKRPPLSQEEKERKEREFLSFDKGQSQESEIKRSGKEPTKTLYLRAPESYWNDIQEIMNMTGLSMNAVCLELLRPAIRKKLRELKEE